MSNIEGVFSIRLVIADFYMEKPTLGLDSCYSEFRGKEIKRVPVIRIFGTNGVGQKTCMHVHGVFPYFYIPYDRRDFETPQKAYYQVACNLDKAINISLGQASSAAQHVFKVQLVKGIPFYGYHRTEHQYLKIYMFNPRFVRRAANLMQSGAIMGKNFHPHESHVPYLLQFMIDYNLYGMSFLHVPQEIIKFRRNHEDERIPCTFANEAQILDCALIKKQTVSLLEVDIAASFILNRFQLAASNSSASKQQQNPGVEAIWHDEKMRRQQLMSEYAADEEAFNKIPVLEVPAPDERPEMPSVESEIFYRSGLLSKLEALESSLSGSSSLANQTLNNTELQTNNTSLMLENIMQSNNKQKRTFNLNKILANSVYPEECSNEDRLMNASHIENHLHNKSIFQIMGSEEFKANDSETAMPCSEEDEKLFLENTVVDEELVLSLTQPHVPLNATLRDGDMELLEVLQQLEAENVAEDEKIDLDSTLAAFKENDVDCTPELLDKETIAALVQTKFSEEEAEQEQEDNFIDFSVAMDELDDILLKLTPSQAATLENIKTDDAHSRTRIPQLDGADDLLKTPQKIKSKARKPKESADSPKHTPKALFMHSPTRSPRTPKVKAAAKYNPLPLIVTSVKKNLNNITSNISEATSTPASTTHSPSIHPNQNLLNSLLTLQKQLAMLENPTASGSCDNKIDKNEATPIATKKEARSKTPVIRKQSSTNNLERTHITWRKSGRLLRIVQTSKKDKANDKEQEPAKEPIKRRGRKPKKYNLEIDIAKTSTAQKKAENFDEPEIIAASDTEEDTCVEQRKKRLRRSFLATSNLDQRVDYKKIMKKFKLRNCKIRLKRLKYSPPSCRKEEIKTPRLTGVQTPRLKTLKTEIIGTQSPSVFSDRSSPVFYDLLTNSPVNFSFSEHLQTEDSIYEAEETIINSKYILRPLLAAPTRQEALEMCAKMDIFEHEHTNPFYSNPEDIGKAKEVGFTVLQIPGNKLNDRAEFESVSTSTTGGGLLAWRRKKLMELGGMNLLNSLKTTHRIREYCAGQQRVWIRPQMQAPSRHDAKLWLKARELLQTSKAEHKLGDEDSPIKVRRQKITMMLNDAEEAGGVGDDMDCSMRSISLTPLTPATPLDTTKKQRAVTDTPLLIQSAGKKKRLRNARAKLSLTAKLKSAVNAEQSKQLNVVEEISNTSMPNSQHSDSSINSDVALSAMERSSFMRNIEEKKLSGQSHDISFGLSRATLDNTFGFKVKLENLQQAKSDIECNYLTIITLEVFVPTRDDLYPNPQIDEVRCIFYAIKNSVPADMDNCKLPQKACGYIMLHDYKDLAREGAVHGLDADICVKIVKTELEAFEALLELCAVWDADIFAGYEIEMHSWGYIIERAKHLCMNIMPLLSRVPTQKVREFIDEDRESMTDLDVEMKLCGRILLDVWRLMRSEIALTSYTFENVMYHIMHKRQPWHSYKDLTNWYITPGMRWIVLEYYLVRVRGTLALLDQLDLIGRTSEMAKLIGIQFYEVLSRGSQFRVESMMLRIAKPNNLVPLSPSVQQRAHMRAPEYLPLIMEPQSRFYADPLIVLDFQSLYPSMIIAYNYCFSTCLGRVEHLGQSTPFEFGAAQLKVSPRLLRKLLDRDLVTISPCGVVFVKNSVREGILPRMLTEILDTRQMVKQSMKLHKSNTALQRILHSRQLGLKLMANVTYGYTAANFSGRMPSVEVGDSVVAKGRETLERAIKMVETNDKWKVRVVYGDTDSLFVLVPGRSREQAFRIGEEIAEAVTKANPFPVKLKLEKVYQPCILQTKKRYVGYMYESADQTVPIYEAKGIETVRRDGCPAVAKMLEKVLRILFESADVSRVKHYVCRQFTKLLSGRANLQDLIFAKEFRGLNGYKSTACVPALELTRKWMQADPRRIPRRGERVPFIIINGPPGVPLIRMVRCPREVLNDAGLKINAIYYITKAIIPPLNRCLLLIGADVNEWFANLPRKLLMTPAMGIAGELLPAAAYAQSAQAARKITISQYFSSSHCALDCGRQTKRGICMECARNQTKCHIVLQTKMAALERNFRHTEFICQACCGRQAELRCNSLDCPVLYVLESRRRELQQIVYYAKLLNEM